jgi:hypothetical protein
VGRRDDFLSCLRSIEFQAALLADNQGYNLNSEITRNLVEEKATELMTAIVCFFNSALIHFNKSLGGNISKQILADQGNLVLAFIKDSKSYDDAKKSVDVAIREYDQAVFHLAVRLVAGTLSQ